MNPGAIERHDYLTGMTAGKSCRRWGEEKCESYRSFLQHCANINGKNVGKECSSTAGNTVEREPKPRRRPEARRLGLARAPAYSRL